MIAIPVRNEAERIGACLTALAAQEGASPGAVVLLLNNCTDATASIVRGLAATLPVTLAIHDVILPEHEAHAGTARSLALRHAARLAGPQGVLLTTDADGVAPPDWLARNLACLRAGADAVAGRAVIDPREARLIPAALHAADARESAYAACLDEIASLLDPDPANPWPRHTEASGASIAATVAAWRAIGGMAPVPLGEDRAFVAALAAHDRLVRHAPEVWVTVSGRIYGRAAGGMADTIRRRLDAPDLFLDERLDRPNQAFLRARLRRRARAAHRSGDAAALARDLGMAPDRLAALLEHDTFGAAWDAIEHASPVLRRRRIAVADLPRETARARALLARLRRGAIPDAPAPPADSAAVPAR